MDMDMDTMDAIVMEDMEDMVVMADTDITAAMQNSLMNRKKRQVR